jgi:hypothetical protein
VAKKTKKKRVRKAWSKLDLSELRKHSKAKTAVVRLEKIFKRGAGTLRQKAWAMGLSLGHQRRKKKRA